MNSAQTAPPPAGTHPIGASLRRSTDDRLLLGLCAGIARATGMNTTGVRIATLALAVVLLPLVTAAYAVTALIVPRDDGSALIGKGTRDQRDIVVAVLFLMVAAPIMLGLGAGSIASGVSAWPALLVASIVAFVITVWKPKALFTREAAAPVASAPIDATWGAGSAAPAATQATAETVAFGSGDPFHGTVTGPYPDMAPAVTAPGSDRDVRDAADDDTLVRGAQPDADAATPSGPSFVKSPGGPTPPSPPAPPAPPGPPTGPAGEGRRRGLAVPVISVLALIPALFAVLVTTGAVDGSWTDWSVMVAILAVLSAGSAVAIALLRPSYLGPALLVILAAILGAASIGINQVGPLVDRGIGDRSYRPTGTDELRPRYELGLGTLDLDLRQLDLKPGTRTPVDVKIGFGEVRIVIPRGVRVVSAPGSALPGLTTSAGHNGATPAQSKTAPVIVLNTHARGADFQLLTGNAVHYENLEVLASESAGFWGGSNGDADVGPPADNADRP